MTYLPRLSAHPDDYSFHPQGPIRPFGRAGLGDSDDFFDLIPSVNEMINEVDVTTVIGKDGARPTAPVLQSTTSPPGSADFLLVGNVCKPRNKPALDIAKSLQVQLNRAGRAMGVGTITVDGEIGAQTVGLLGRVSPGVIPAGASCQAVTGQLSFLLSTVQSIADNAGAPPPSQSELAGVARAGVINVRGTNGKTYLFKPPGVQASIVDRFRAMPDTTKIVLGGVVLLGGIFAFKRFRARRGGGGAPAGPALPAAAPKTNPRRRRRRRR